MMKGFRALGDQLLSRDLSVRRALGESYPYGITLPSFVPTDIASLIRWYAIRDASTIFQDNGFTTPAASNGDVIGGVTDKSSASVNASQATTSLKPTLSIGVTSLNSMLGDADDWLGFTTTGALTDFTAFAVCRLNGAGLSNIFTNTSNNQDRIQLAAGALGLRASFSTTTITAASVYPIGTTFIMAIRRESGALKGYLNAADVTNGSPSTVTAVTFTKILNPFPGYMGEALLFNAALSVDDMNSMWTYLNGLWSVY